jgi:hypothetical protein
MVRRVESIGADDLILHPVAPGIEQFERLEQALG